LVNLFLAVFGFHGAPSIARFSRSSLKRDVKVVGETMPESAFAAKIIDEAEDTIVLSTFITGGTHPEGLLGDIQLEEMEEDVTQVTGLHLFPDGSMAYLQTDGPPPLKFSGEWACVDNGSTLWISLTRGFANERVKGADYEVTRVLVGSVEDHAEYTTVAGSIRTPNDAAMIKMGLEDDTPIGYFTLLRLPDDVDEPRHTLQVRKV